ncbi:MAG: acyl carrier protein [Candidatus Staskawiczbacteria bacterium RIFCSPHIGHO2_01_FULL_41_41]|uniref:Acyl carrier protein n=1 Tax=Candidatus Staskawiczbacteria bacterium RIFCSPHIGHO2_01_FULL_41_41 TaxID=1802203 RepID=A0A1G2HSD2_9BACT|nr:MAG: acyl carrier protein [Candidatus Staskawiczbacteria bacterium RIFCSPHIGHO2_01_FULL_41_41]HLD80270.1 acyl carrier protein [Candidatus Nanoarchaeia archaeon]
MEQLKKIISEVMEISVDQIDDNFSRKNNSEWDSFNHLALIAEIERKVNLEFTLEEIDQIITFKDLCEIVSRK